MGPLALLAVAASTPISLFMPRPADHQPPAYLSKSPPVPEPEPAEPAPPPTGDKPRRDPTRYGDWEKKGIAWDF